MTNEDVHKFAEELNALTRKYGVKISRTYGPLLMLKDSKYGTDYSGHRPDIAKKNDQDEWTISEPWGG
jgi:hypothetical protein